MLKVVAFVIIEYRFRIREFVREKIKEFEFKVVFEFFVLVVRFVLKDEIVSNFKVKVVFDKEWDNFRNKGVWDEKRVRECRDIVVEVRRNG